MGFKLSHSGNSGRLRPHEHTSYIPLVFLLLVVGIALTFYSITGASPGPQSGSIGLTGVVQGVPPSTPATILVPTDGKHFSQSLITVSGTCPTNTLVEIFKNDIFAGSTACTSTGTFTIQIDLLYGQNLLSARVYDQLNQQGPNSNTPTVFYDILPPQAGPLSVFNFGARQLLLNTDAVYRGVFPQQEFSMPIDILGGTPPYAVNVQWGDANNKVVSRSDNLTFRVPHSYQKAGTYQISIQATDSQSRVAFLGVAAIVNGQPAALAGSTTPTSVPNQLLLLWPVYTSAIAIVISFWLGERREKKLLAKQQIMPLLPTQS